MALAALDDDFIGSLLNMVYCLGSPLQQRDTVYDYAIVLTHVLLTKPFVRQTLCTRFFKEDTMCLASLWLGLKAFSIPL